MTYREGEGYCGGEVVPELSLRMEGDVDNGDYFKLEGCSNDSHAEEQYIGVPEPSSSSSSPAMISGALWCWVRLVLLFVFLGLLAVVCIKWVGPFLMDKEIIPLINWETTTFSIPNLAVLVFSSVAIFPTIFLPSTPSMWVAGITFGYGYGFVLIISGAVIGVSLPFLIGSVFSHKIQGWLEKYPKRASVLRSAGEGDWFHQFRAVTLIRISPFPYIIYNYCAVATNVRYTPYLLGSLVGLIPEIFVSIYTGIFVKALADASHQRHGLSAPQIVFSVIGFCATVATTIVFTMSAKRRLKQLQNEDRQLLR